MSKNDILVSLLRVFLSVKHEVLALFLDLARKVVNKDEGHLWVAALKAFLRKEAGWAAVPSLPIESATPLTPTLFTAPTLRAEVDTDLDPQLPFEGAIIDTHIKMGTVVIERRGDELWINGRKVGLHLSERQLNGRSLKGYELREELTGKPVLNACILDFLIAHTGFIPESWKKDVAGNTSYIYFWGTIYRLAGGNLCVRSLFWFGGAWNRDFFWLGFDWFGPYPAALLAS